MGANPAPDCCRVLMVNTYQTGGGAGRVGELLAAGLRDGGARVSAFVVAAPLGDPHCTRAGHWRDRALSGWLSRHGFPELGHLSSFGWRCRDEYASADVLHWHNLHGDFVSITAMPMWGLDKPAVWTLHDLWALTGNCAFPYTCDRWRRNCGHCPALGVYPMSAIDRSSVYRWLKPKLIAAARPLLVAPSQWLADHVRRVPELARLPLRVIPNPVACDVFRPRSDRAALRRSLELTPDAPTVMLAGFAWNEYRKGGPDAVAALRRAAKRVGRLQILVVGLAGDDLLRDSGLPGRALPFLRQRDALARAYACADLCLLPSRAENYPLTTLEAMACGTPVVAYNVGGVPEQIIHQRTGLIARDGNVDELAAGVARLAGDPERARRMGTAARELVERTNSVEVVVAAYRRVYADAIGAWRRRHPGRSPRFARGRLAKWLAHKAGWESGDHAGEVGSRGFRPARPREAAATESESEVGAMV